MLRSGPHLGLVPAQQEAPGGLWRQQRPARRRRAKAASRPAANRAPVARRVDAVELEGSIAAIAAEAARPRPTGRADSSRAGHVISFNLCIIALERFHLLTLAPRLGSLAACCFRASLRAFSASSASAVALQMKVQCSAACVSRCLPNRCGYFNSQSRAPATATVRRAARRLSDLFGGLDPDIVRVLDALEVGTGTRVLLGEPSRIQPRPSLKQRLMGDLHEGIDPVGRLLPVFLFRASQSKPRLHQWPGPDALGSLTGRSRQDALWARWRTRLLSSIPHPHEMVAARNARRAAPPARLPEGFNPPIQA